MSEEGTTTGTLAPGAVVLDTGPLSLVTQRPGRSPDADAAQAWMAELAQAAIPVFVPEVADYELRRELLRAGHTASVARLEQFNAAWPARYLALTTPVMRLAAELWAQARRTGLPTSSQESLDVDVILAAQALTLASAGTFPGVVVATTNPGHLTRFVTAAEWQKIRP